MSLRVTGKLLNELEGIFTNRVCWGVRSEHGNLIVFYHPWGCESEVEWPVDLILIPTVTEYIEKERAKR